MLMAEFSIIADRMEEMRNPWARAPSAFALQNPRQISRHVRGSDVVVRPAEENLVSAATAADREAGADRWGACLVRGFPAAAVAEVEGRGAMDHPVCCCS